MNSLTSAPSFDPSQFKLQPDGTFRISIRGMAAMEPWAAVSNQPLP